MDIIPLDLSNVPLLPDRLFLPGKPKGMSSYLYPREVRFLPRCTPQKSKC